MALGGPELLTWHVLQNQDLKTGFRSSVALTFEHTWHVMAAVRPVQQM